ncbi:hypothetical protein PYCC9005_001362 [Savitreella phatthalungensis]
MDLPLAGVLLAATYALADLRLLLSGYPAAAVFAVFCARTYPTHRAHSLGALLATLVCAKLASSSITLLFLYSSLVHTLVATATLALSPSARRFCAPLTDAIASKVQALEKRVADLDLPRLILPDDGYFDIGPVTLCLPKRRLEFASINAQFSLDPTTRFKIAASGVVLVIGGGLNITSAHGVVESRNKQNISRPPSIASLSEDSPRSSLDEDPLAAAIEETMRQEQVPQIQRDSTSVKPPIALHTDSKASDSEPVAPTRSVLLSDLRNRLFSFLLVTPPPTLARFIMAAFCWLHPIVIVKLSCAAPGRRVTQAMEQAGFRRSHKDPEISRLIRKVFSWLEAGTLSIVLEDVRIVPGVPLSTREPVAAAPEGDDLAAIWRPALTAGTSTAYRHSEADSDEVLARLTGIKTIVSLPVWLLPLHDRLAPVNPDHYVKTRVVLEYLARLPGVFNTELLTIGAAFIKAATMLDIATGPRPRPAEDTPISSPAADETLEGKRAPSGLASALDAENASGTQGVEEVKPVSPAARRPFNTGRGNALMSSLSSMARDFVNEAKRTPPPSALSRSSTATSTGTTSAPSGSSWKAVGRDLAIKATKLAKQKGLAWGVRDAELAKAVAKFTKLAARGKLDVGGRAVLYVDVAKYLGRLHIKKLPPGYSPPPTTSTMAVSIDSEPATATYDTSEKDGVVSASSVTGPLSTSDHVDAVDGDTDVESVHQPFDKAVLQDLAASPPPLLPPRISAPPTPETASVAPTAITALAPTLPPRQSVRRRPIELEDIDQPGPERDPTDTPATL